MTQQDLCQAHIDGNGAGEAFLFRLKKQEGFWIYECRACGLKKDYCSHSKGWDSLPEARDLGWVTKCKNCKRYDVAVAGCLEPLDDETYAKRWLELVRRCGIKYQYLIVSNREIYRRLTEHEP